MEATTGSVPMFDLGADNFFQESLDAFATVNPLDLQAPSTDLLEDLAITNPHYYELDQEHDSGVDVNPLDTDWSPKNASTDLPSDQFASSGESPMVANSSSPGTDMAFSHSNSPDDLARDQSATSSPEAEVAVVPKKESDADSPHAPADVWSTPYASEAILIPEPRETPNVYLVADRNKTRAETQIKIHLTLDPLDNVEHIRFPRKTLAKPKHFASDEERHEIEAKGGVVDMNVYLVCATAVESTENRERAMRRAAGTEEVPRRPEGISISELDKEDPAHPQNGGEVLICEGCKERERKRYDRKKKRGEDEDEFSKYENDRVIMINEKEHKRLKDVDGEDSRISLRAKQVDFAMRIACYCRHQEEKSPMGYRVIFTFTIGKAVLAQHMSEVFHITDDHKNKETAPDLPQRIAIPAYNMGQYHPQSNVVVPMYSYSENPFGAMNPYSQPTSVAMPQFASPVSPMNNAFPSSTMATVGPNVARSSMSSMSSLSSMSSMSNMSAMNQSMSTSMPQSMSQSMPQTMHQMPSLSQQARQPAPAFPGSGVSTNAAPYAPSTAVSTNAATYARHQRTQSYYETPLMSPTHGLFEPHGMPITRPQSMDNFNFNFAVEAQQYAQQNQYYNSAPPSAGGTPINLSRPASPTWEQGPNKKGKTLRCVYFYVDE